MTTMYQAIVTYEVDKTFTTIIAESDIWPTRKMALEDLLGQVDHIVFEKFSIRQSEGEPNPYVDESDVQGCAAVIYADDKNPTDDDRLAYENIDAFRAWIMNGFQARGITDVQFALTDPFYGWIKEVTVHTNIADNTWI